MQSIRGKKSFTLIELIIVVFLIFTTYFLMFSSSSFDLKEEKKTISLENLKEFLLDNFKFEKDLSFVCIENNLTCYVKIDENIVYDSKIENFFRSLPEVYEYNKDELKIEFSQIKINDINEDIIFELKINSDFKSNDFIVDTLEDRVYVFNSLFNKPFEYKNLQEAFEVFYSNEIEVRDAFKYSGFDSNGKKVKSKIEANSLEEAKSKLKVKGILYTSIFEDDFNFSKIKFKRRKTLSLSNLSYISRDLSIYLNSGISLISAINLLKQRYKNDKKLSSFFESIETYLDEGKTFYQALDTQTAIKLPEFYKQSIKISESGGLLESVLLELSVFLKEQDAIKKQVSSALIYPLFILFVSFFMVGFMLSVVVPKITGIFDKINQELPTSTKIVIKLGDFFSNNYGYVILAFILVISIFIFLLKKSKSFKYAFDKLCLKVPFFSTMIEQGELARFSYMNSILIKSGVPIVQAINLSANILKNSVIKKVFVDASSSVVEGKKLSILLMNNKTYKIDEAFIHSIAIGEDTSKLSQILNNLANLYNEANKDKTNVFLSLLEPVFMLFVGVTIGFIVISMLLPIFSMNLG